jgi:hypothetical protein
MVEIRITDDIAIFNQLHQFVKIQNLNPKVLTSSTKNSLAFLAKLEAEKKNRLAYAFFSDGEKYRLLTIQKEEKQ